jgi:N-carbamoylputrescine amidase
MAKEKKYSQVKVGLIQTDAFDEKDKNLKKHLDLITKAAKKGAKVICLQELFMTKYFCCSEETRNFSLAETVPGATTEALSTLARKLEIVIIASLFEKRTEGVYHNTAVVIDADGKLVGKYRKMHIPDDPLFYEKFYFTPGDLGYNSFETRYGRIAVLVCWDQWFPEAARLVTLSGAQMIFYPTAIGWKEDEVEKYRPMQLEAWKTMHCSHAISNGVFVFGANRIGKEDELCFWGNSIAYDPFGSLLAKGSQDKEEIIIVDVDLSKIETMRQGWPFLRDRRIDSYNDLLRRFKDN